MNETNYQDVLKNILLDYRTLLTIPKDVNFGLEIEIDNTSFDEVERKVINRFGKSYSVHDDLSLAENGNAEISTPVYTNTKETWKTLKKLSDTIKSVEHDFNAASFQINFDGSLLETDHKKALLFKLFSYYEDIIYIFSLGFNDQFRDNFDMYAFPITLDVKSFLDKDDTDLLNYFSDQKRFGLNYKTKNDVIEIRTPNGTDDISLWQNYVTLFYYLISFVNSNKLSEKELDNYIRNFNDYDILSNIYNFNLSRALEYGNKMFRNKYDRQNFIYQYTKIIK